MSSVQQIKSLDVQRNKKMWPTFKEKSSIYKAALRWPQMLQLADRNFTAPKGLKRKCMDKEWTEGKYRNYKKNQF